MTRAQLSAATDAQGRAIPERQRTPIPVQFNPETLELTIRSAIGENEDAKKKGNGKKQQPPQVVSNTTVTLTLQLIFDTTTTGADVRRQTAKVAALMKPGDVQAGKDVKKVPSLVVFEWSTFVFEGAISDYKETLDFFAAEGVPQRATLSLTLTQQDKPFPTPKAGPGADTGGSFSDLAPPAPLGSGQSVDQMAANGGDRGAAPAIAAANGIENRRRPEVGAVAVPPAGASPGRGGGGRGPAAFASGAAGAGAGAGAGFGASAGASAGVGFGASAGASLGASAGAGFGASAGAGFGASANAQAGATAIAGGRASAFATADTASGASAAASVASFGKLNMQASLVPERPRVQISLPAVTASATAVAGFGASAGVGAGAGLSLGLSAQAGAGVSLGGAARASAGAGLSAEVGAGASVSAIVFAE